MLENDFLLEVKNYVFELFKNSLPVEVLYHNFDHTIQVVEASHEIGLAENISDEDMEMLLLAAWFHDTGYTVGYEDHEQESQNIASTFLADKGMSEEKISKIKAIIQATAMPQNPKDKLGEIICDADLYHLGAEDFNKKSNLLRSEFEMLCSKEFSDTEWLEENDAFLTNHKFFTNTAFEKLNAQKALNRLKIQKDIKKIKAKELEQSLKIKLKKEDLNRKKNKDERPDRGIETMFRVTLRNHIKLSDIADTKANILLSVSAITMSIVLTNLFPKLDKPDNYYLVYPTIFFIVVAVITMVFSILSTMPKVTSGIFTKEDVKNKKVNLLFFGNFHKMPLENFQNGMNAMMNDRDYLYNSLMKDLYYLGIVLNKKYKLLRVAYTVFMIGIIVSIVAFFISFMMMEIKV